MPIPHHRGTHPASRALSVLVIAAIAAAAFTGSHAIAGISPLDTQVQTLTAQKASAEASLETTVAHRNAAVAKLDETTAAHTTRQSVLDARPAFLEAVKGTDASFQSAAGKVDASAQRAAVIAAQQAVLAERADPAVIAAQTEAVKAAGVDVAAQVKAYDDRIAAEKAARAKASQPKSPQKQTGSAPRSNTSRGTTGGGSSGGNTNSGGGSSVNWLDDLRGRLNSMGGGWTNLIEYDGYCGNKNAAGCSWWNGTIGVTSAVASWTSSRKNWLMAHELAHQHHFKVWDAVAASPGYQQLFGSSAELLADCMASARGYTDHSRAGQCTADRINWARGIWSGQIAW
mgnify:CR=1 FL=1